MLTSIKQFFDQYIAPRGEDEGHMSEHSLQLATAALLIEMMRMDDEVAEDERQVVRDILNSRFSLSDSETGQLMALAEEEAAGLADYYQFTSLINKNFSPPQRVKLVEHLWQVAYADGQLDKHEEHLVRKLAELLYVPHSAFIAAKHRAVK
ncbi:MAG TPA: TerB family tellurite resistance protein [Gammaproteobacteria bacterium]|nr:TerB family tellurite resistance protein [Gammaproteobacteria bacterium]